MGEQRTEISNRETPEEEAREQRDQPPVHKDEDGPDVDASVVPVPAVDTAREHQRVRSSNDRDQQLERDGQVVPHNQGYDEVVDLTPTVPVEPADE